jgi:predicted transcriptional regulator
MRTQPPGKLKMLGVEDVRETNELKLLHIIRDRQPISRVDLVKATGLRAGTVSVIVNRLLRASVVHEGELAPSSGGRPATYLQINAEKAYVVGISIAGQLTANFRRGRLAGVGVSVPGLIDRADGCLVRSPNLGRSNVPIVPILERKLLSSGSR